MVQCAESVCFNVLGSWAEYAWFVCFNVLGSRVQCAWFLCFNVLGSRVQTCFFRVLQPVAFPADNFDVFEYCTPELKARLQINRERYDTGPGVLVYVKVGGRDRSVSATDKDVSMPPACQFCV